MKQILLILLIYTQLLVQAQQFYVRVPSNTLPENQTLEVSYVADNIKAVSLELPTFKDFIIVGGPMTNISVEMVNFKSKEITEWVYYLKPKHSGTCILEPVKLRSSNKVYSSQSITIAVTSVNQNSATTTAPTSVQRTPSDKFIYKILADKSEVYEGEDIVFSYILYFNESFSDGFPSDRFNQSAFDVIEFFDKKSDQTESRVQLGTKSYTSIVVYRVLARALKPGNYTIPKSYFTLQVPNASASILDELLGRSTEPIVVGSNELKIKVKALPPNPPATFSGVVGAFDMKCSVNKNKAKTDEPIQYKIDIRGKGNADHIVNLKLKTPDFLETYDPQRNSTHTYSDFQRDYSLHFDYMITPHEPGSHSIISPEFSYFNTQLEQYVTIPIDTIPIEISGNPTPYQTSKTAATTLAFKPQKTMGKRIRNTNSASIPIPLFTFICSSPLLLLLFLFISTKQKNKSISTNNQLESSIQQIENLYMLNNKDTCAAVNRILYSSMRQQFNNNHIAQIQDVKKVLELNGYSAEDIIYICKTIENNEQNAYMPFVNQHVDIDSKNRSIACIKLIYKK